MGYYGGLGARKVATVTPSATLPQAQPACLTDATTGLDRLRQLGGVGVVGGAGDGGLRASTSPRSTRDDTGGASHIVFVVRDDDGHSDLLFQTSDTTWQAYNQYGGNSLYVGGPARIRAAPTRSATTGRSRRADTSPEDWVFNAEYPMVRWLEANGYDVSYSTGVDTDRRGAELLEHKVFLSVGHDEYWSGAQRANVEAARDAGVNLAFFSGNEVFWKTRWENSIDGRRTPYRTLVCYKETHANAKIDPTANVWTGTWRDPRFSPPADGGRPENALTGTIFTVNCRHRRRSRSRRPTASCGSGGTPTSPALAAGQIATLPTGTLGYEWDEDLDNGFRPAGPDPAVRHDAVTSVRSSAGLRLDLRRRDGDARADAVPRTERRARLRRRHGAVVVGSRRQPRPRLGRAEPRRCSRRR